MSRWDVRKSKKGNITRKLVFSFSILIIIFMSFGLVTLYDIQSISGLTRTIYDHPLVVSNSALQSNVSITKMHRHMKDVVLFNSANRIRHAIEAVDHQEKLVYEYLDIVRDRILGDDGKKLEIGARKLFENWQPIRREVINLVEEGKRKEAAEITIGKGAAHVMALENSMIALTNYARSKATSFMKDAEETHSRLNVITVIFLVSGTIAAVLVAFITLRQTSKAENDLQESEKRYRMLIESQVDLVSRFSPDGQFNFVNDVFCQFFNKSKEDIMESNWQPLPVDDDVEYIEEKLSMLSPKNTTVTIENRVYSGKGEVHWMQFINKGFFDVDENLIEIQSVGRDVTERKRAEKIIQESLQEKEVLLKEIHHRVKNNMQIIQSLLNIQADKLSEVELKKPLIESNNRIKSMALIHETLYRSDDISKLDIKAYFQNISKHLIRIYQNHPKKIAMKVSVDPIELDMDLCIACGLIINELVSNALKYAFTDMSESKLEIALTNCDEEKATLLIRDYGKGFPESIDLKTAESMGLKIVRILAEGQLKGTLSVKIENGTAFYINFPLPTKKQV